MIIFVNLPHNKRVSPLHSFNINHQSNRPTHNTHDAFSMADYQDLGLGFPLNDANNANNYIDAEQVWEAYLEERRANREAHQSEMILVVHQELFPGDRMLTSILIVIIVVLVAMRVAVIFGLV